MREFEPLTLYLKYLCGGIGIRNGLRTRTIESSNLSIGTEKKYIELVDIVKNFSYICNVL